MSVDLQSVNVSIAGRQIVRDVCLQIRDGQRVGLIGSSGSGKSMIARAIMGLLPQDAQLSGSINVNGTQTVGMNDVRLVKAARCGDGHGVPESGGFAQPVVARA